MQLVLDPAENAAHGDWLRRTPGAYEWWYFDALSDSGEWALTCIWFLGNPFSPYYRRAALRQSADPYGHNALFFAVYRWGRLHAYHFTRFPASEVTASERLPLHLRFGPNHLRLFAEGCGHLTLSDENANCRRVTASLTLSFPAREPQRTENISSDSDAAHFWLPAAPFCRVAGQISLKDALNSDAQAIQFAGTGYHDHNWGQLPFADDIRDWYWARAVLEGDQVVILYHLRYRRPNRVASHLLLFEQGRLLRHDADVQVRLSHRRMNGFGTRYATHLAAASGDIRVLFRLRPRLDSAPFYVRALCEAVVTQGARAGQGRGIGEYFRPRMMSWPLVASAMKARIVEA